MPLRVINYDGSAYRAQLDEEGDPKYPVITIVLSFDRKNRWKNKTLHDCLEIDERLKPFVSNYKINVFDVAFLTDSEIDCFHSDFRIVADYFAHSRIDPYYRPKNPVKFKHAVEVLELLSAMTHDSRYEDAIEGGVPQNMCEVLDKLVEKATMDKAKEDALNMRNLMNINDPALVAQVVGVATELVERWFEGE